MAKIAAKRERLTAGVVAAALTPMGMDGVANCKLLAGHCMQLLADGCSSIVLLGTTGEANSFSVAERQAILESVIARSVSANALIVGTGCCAIGDTVALTRHALSLGVRRVLMLPPFYYKNLTDAGLFDAYAATFHAVNDDRLRVYLYLIPQMTGVEMATGFIEKLYAAFPSQIGGLKDSSGNWPATEDLCRELGDTIDVLVGSEAFLVRGLKAGASGCVTATANVGAKAIVELFTRSADALPHDELERKVDAARAAFEAFPLIPALKAYLAASTGIVDWRNVRPPLAPLAESETVMLMRLYERT